MREWVDRLVRVVYEYISAMANTPLPRCVTFALRRTRTRHIDRYDPDHYTTENDWQTRLTIECSTAIKAWQYIGAGPGVVES